MSEWWSFVAVFWTLYLADGVSGGRREQIFFSSWLGEWRWRFWRRARVARPPRTASVSQTSWHFAPPFPWAYTLPLDDLPASFTAEGFTNWPTASTSRPPPLPDRPLAAVWEAPGKFGTDGAWITLGGVRFAPVTSALDGRALREMTEKLAGLNPARRAAAIRAWQSRRFSVLRARRRLGVGLARTRKLAWLNTLQTVGWIALSVALVRGAFDPGLPFGTAGSWRWLDPAQIRWWVLCGSLLAMHLLAIGMTWRLHRKLHPRLKSERSNLIFGSLLLPSQALRLRAALLRPLAQGLAPLAFALAAGSADTARAAAAATLRDVVFPARPKGLPPAVSEMTDAANALSRSAIERALADASADGVAGLHIEELLAEPSRDGAEVCAYCPRCGDGFLRPDGVCPQGVKLQRYTAGGERSLGNEAN